MSKVLDRALTALQDPKNWVKMQGFGDGNCLCLGGHLAVAGGLKSGERLSNKPETEEAKDAVVKAIQRLFPRRYQPDMFSLDPLEPVIWRFNDHHETTHADVLAVAREAQSTLDTAAVAA